MNERKERKREEKGLKRKEIRMKVSGGMRGEDAEKEGGNENRNIKR